MSISNVIVTYHMNYNGVIIEVNQDHGEAHSSVYQRITTCEDAISNELVMFCNIDGEYVGSNERAINAIKTEVFRIFGRTVNVSVVLDDIDS